MPETNDSKHRIEAPAPESGQIREVVVNGRAVLLCNVDGELYALQKNCTHAGVPLGGGRLRGHRLECPLHGAVFDVRSGAVLSPPARKPLDVYPVEREGSEILVEFPR